MQLFDISRIFSTYRHESIFGLRSAIIGAIPARLNQENRVQSAAVIIQVPPFLSDISSCRKCLRYAEWKISVIILLAWRIGVQAHWGRARLLLDCAHRPKNSASPAKQIIPSTAVESLKSFHSPNRTLHHYHSNLLVCCASTSTMAFASVPDASVLTSVRATKVVLTKEFDPKLIVDSFCLGWESVDVKGPSGHVHDNGTTWSK